MKKWLTCLMALILVLGVFPALADGNADYVYDYEPVLSGLTHNCPNTGILLPEKFDPDMTSYLLSVGNNVSRVCFTPTCKDPNATIRVNGTVLRSGATSSYIQINDKPQMVEITVTNMFGEMTAYTIFIQRRPSTLRTRVSAGYIEDIYQKGSAWTISADLVTLKYSSGNLSTFNNAVKDLYKYACAENCLFYYGDKENPIRAYDVIDFANNYLNYGSSLYYLVYIEDKIVAVIPYDKDY